MPEIEVWMKCFPDFDRIRAQRVVKMVANIGLAAIFCFSQFIVHL